MSQKNNGSHETLHYPTFKSKIRLRPPVTVPSGVMRWLPAGTCLRFLQTLVRMSECFLRSEVIHFPHVYVADQSNETPGTSRAIATLQPPAVQRVVHPESPCRCSSILTTHTRRLGWHGMLDVGYAYTVYRIRTRIVKSSVNDLQGEGISLLVSRCTSVTI